MIVRVSELTLDDVITKVKREDSNTLLKSLKDIGAKIEIDPKDEPDLDNDDVDRQARTNEDEYIASLFIGSHTPVIVDSVCPLCVFVKAESYDGHGPLLRCASPKCKKTYDPTVEGVGYVMTHEEEDADTQAED